LSLDGWRTIAEGKTGALFAWCGRAAALVAGREDLAGPFGGFGRRLGVAFQLADDLKDVVGGDPSKERFADLKSATPSMPILWAAQSSVEARTELEATFKGERTAAEIAGTGAKLIEVGAHRAVAQALQIEAREAIACLSVLGEASWLGEIEGLAQSFAGECIREVL
jgi:geranylgeranyl pyrophosphate synthase